MQIVLRLGIDGEVTVTPPHQCLEISPPMPRQSQRSARLVNQTCAQLILDTIMRYARPIIFAAAALASSPTLAESVAIEGVKDDALRAEIAAAIPTAPNPPETLFDARRRAETAAEAALSVLYANGYFGADVEAQASDAPKPRAVLKVIPGPLFHFLPASVVFAGDGNDQDLFGAVVKASSLKNGAPAKSSDVLKAESLGFEALRNAGHAEAVILEREAVADHATNTLAVTFHYKPGPKIVLGDLKIMGAAKTSPKFVDQLESWKPGDPYTPETIETLSRRASDTGIYDVVAPSLAPDGQIPNATPNSEERRDVLLDLKERKRRTITLGASYSTSEGVGVEASHVWRNLSGKGETLTASTRLAQLERVLNTEIAYPHWKQPDHTLRVGAEIAQSETDAYDQRKIKLSAGVETERRLRAGLGYGLTLDATRVKDALGERDLYIGGLFANLRTDSSDNLLDPTQGIRTEFRVEPIGVLGDSKVSFLKATATASAYRKLDKKARTVAAARLRFGSMAGAPLTSVPADYRFYAGGGGSVRGFDHQALSPRTFEVTASATNDFAAFGGKSLVEGSLELRWHPTPNWGAVAFIDAGAAGIDSTPDFSSVRTGAGIGLRYYTDFGPLRFDLATPLDAETDESKLQFYVSIGQSF